MAAPATEAVYTRLRQAAIYGVENRINPALDAIRYSDAGDVTVYSDAYYYNWVRAFDPPRNFEKFQEYPSCNVFVENDASFNSDNTQLDQNQGKLLNAQILSFDCIHTDTNNQSVARDRMLADLQTYFGINYYIPDLNGAQTAFNVYYDSSIPFMTEGNNPKVGITVRFKVWYNQTLINPRVIR